MKEATRQLETPAGLMECHEAAPDGPARGAVVVIMEAFGVNDYIRRVARDLASKGYHAFAPDLFHRTGAGTVPYDDIPRVIEMIGTLDDEGILEDIDATLGVVRSAGHDDRRIGVVGFCIGGRFTFLVSAVRPLGAGVTYYGGGIVSTRSEKLPSLIGEAPALRTPWLGLFGDEDASIPVTDVERLREALRDAPVPTEIVRYADAGHGFHCDQRDSFRPDPAADAWQRTLSWFERHLARPQG